MRCYSIKFISCLVRSFLGKVFASPINDGLLLCRFQQQIILVRLAGGRCKTKTDCLCVRIDCVRDDKQKHVPPDGFVKFFFSYFLRPAVDRLSRSSWSAKFLHYYWASSSSCIYFFCRLVEPRFLLHRGVYLRTTRP